MAFIRNYVLSMRQRCLSTGHKCKRWSHMVLARHTELSCVKMVNVIVDSKEAFDNWCH